MDGYKYPRGQTALQGKLLLRLQLGFLQQLEGEALLGLSATEALLGLRGTEADPAVTELTKSY